VALPKVLADAMNDTSKLWIVLIAMALTPAICEELAFRGFILSGLRHMGHKWRAIIVSSVIFGFTHLMFQQSIGTTLIGIVVGYLAVQTGSILPPIIFHFGHNAMTLTIAHFYEKPDVQPYFLPYVRPLSGGDFIYEWWVFGLGVIVAGWLLVKFSNLSYRKSEEEAIEEKIERLTVELNA
jgi:sodium transport system permease protein